MCLDISVQHTPAITTAVVLWFTKNWYLSLLSLNKKSLRLKQLRLSLTKQLRSSKDCIQSVTSSIFSGKILLKTVAEEMSSSMRPENSTVMPRTGLTEKRLSLSSTREDLSVRRRATKQQEAKLPLKKEVSS